jgi:hypothetical protein
MLVIWTPKRPPRGRRALIPRSCNTSVYLCPYQPSWAPQMHDFPRSVCSCRSASLFWTPRILRRNEGLPVGCAPDGPAKYFRVLGHLCFETFLRLACLGWLCQTPRSHVGYLDVSTLQSVKINRFLASTSTTLTISSSVSLLTTSSCDAPFKILLDILGYWMN